MPVDEMDQAELKRKPGFAKGLLPNSEVLFDPALDKEIEDLFYPKNEPTVSPSSRNE
jgi:hypothetical protein